MLSLGLSGFIYGLFNIDKFGSKSYFQSDEFSSDLKQFTDYLSMYEFNKMTEKEAVKKITVTADEIETYRHVYGTLPEQIESIKSQYDDKIQFAREENNQEVADAYMAERDQKIAEIKKNFSETEYVKSKIIAAKKKAIHQYFQEKESSRWNYENYKTAFKYYLQDTKTKEIYTNVKIPKGESVENYLDDKNSLYIITYPSKEQGYFFNAQNGLAIDLMDELGRNLYEEYSGKVDSEQSIMAPIGKEGTFTGKIAVYKSAPSTHPVMKSYLNYQKNTKVIYIVSFIGVLFLLISVFLYKKTTVSRTALSERWLPYYHKIPIDLAVFIFVLSIILTLILLDKGIYDYWGSYLRETIMLLMLQVLFLAAVIIQGHLLYIRVKRGSFIEDLRKSLIYHLFCWMKEAFLIRSVGVQALIILMIIFGLGAGAGMVLIQYELIILYALFFLVIGLPTLLLLVRSIGNFNQIILFTESLVNGDTTQKILIKGKSIFAKEANYLNCLKQEVKQSRKAQAKSERLKTELITNVSHDLRTPLTSIITYTELLKSPEIAEEDRNTYIQIIDRKSQRLKILIDDLFEASKMASGNMEIEKEKVDINQLLQQSLAEYNEMIGNSTLQFRVSTPETPVYAMVDGQKLWRVFDNLIGNIIKYSLNHTRVYINVKTTEELAIITFKNVTKYELGENVDELFERFKRGDTSRHTDGSGLGLAIAKSIVDLHGGSLEIDLDGDLFKVTVQIDRIDR